MQPKVSHFFMVPLLIGLQDESRRVIPAPGMFIDDISSVVFSSWTFGDQIGRGKTPRLAGVAQELEDRVGGVGEKIPHPEFAGLAPN